MPAGAGTCTVMIALARNKRKKVKLEQNFASAFTDTARLLSVDQPIFAVGAELHALGAVAIIGYDFSRAIALLTKHTYRNSAVATTVTTGHQRASMLLYWEGGYLSPARFTPRVMWSKV
jgi:L-rhamnose isomerase